MTESGKSTLAILAVEDDAGIGELLHALLNDIDGWGATVARDAAAARSVFHQVQVDVLVIDIELPGITGLELLELLRHDAGWNDQSVIVVSAQAHHPEVREAVKAGRVTQALMKPFDIDRLVAVIAGAAAR
jgi:DNA-binding response OmpR family regulator